MKKIEFLKDHGSFSKGDKVELGDFAADSLVNDEVAKLVSGKPVAKKTAIKTKELKVKKVK